MLLKTQTDSDASHDSNDTETSLKRHQNDTETSQKHTNNKDNNTTVVEGEETAAISLDDSYKRINTYFSNNIHLITPVEFQKIQYWVEDEGMHEDVIMFAIEEAVNQGQRKMSYIEGILKDLNSKGIKTRIEAEQEKEKFKKRKSQKPQKTTTGRPEKPSFNNFTNRTYDAKVMQRLWKNSCLPRAGQSLRESKGKE